MGCSISKAGLKARTESSGLIKVPSNHSSGRRADSFQRCTRESDAPQITFLRYSEHEIGEIDAQEKTDLRSLMKRDSISDEQWDGRFNPDLPSLKALMEESNAYEQFEQKPRFRVEQSTCQTTTNDVADSETFEGCSRNGKKCYSSNTTPASGNAHLVEFKNEKKHLFLEKLRSISCKFQKENWFLTGIRLLKAGIYEDSNLKEKHLADRRESLRKDYCPIDKINGHAIDCMFTPIVPRPQILRSGSLKSLFYGASLQNPEQEFLNDLYRRNSASTSPNLLQDDIERRNYSVSYEESSYPEEAEDSASVIFDPRALDISDTTAQQVPVDGGSYQARISDTASSFPPRCCFEEVKDELHVLSVLMAETDQGQKSTAEVFNIKHLHEIKQTMHTRKITSSKVSALELEEKKLKANALQRFEFKCPPGGGERVVLYSTSLRGIRKTYDDCNNLKMLLQGYFVQVDDRDVSMHLAFKQEIHDLLGQPLHVPKLFMKGRYIGGADEVLRLNEEGTLARLLEDLPRKLSSKPCDGCGGVRFAPCTECNGSCKIISQNNEPIQCQSCNENGLIRCAICF